MTSTYFMGRHSIKKLPTPISSEDDWKSNFNRGKHVVEVDQGNSTSAMILARYYGALGITEAQLYWLKRAKQMGDDQVSDEVIEACEESIFASWR